MSGNLTIADLEASIASGETDTVIVAFADAQGRLVGKRVSARFFLETVLPHGAEACNYLLSVDVDMNTVDGYAMSSWETGYGDMLLLSDPATLRRIPWLPGTALVMADLAWEGGAPVVQSPREILKRQTARLAERGLVAYSGTELEFIVFDDTYRDAWAKGYRALTPVDGLQRRLQPARLDPARTAAARHPPRHGRRGTVLRGRQGGVQLRPAGDRVPVRGGHRDRRSARHLQERREGDRGAARQGADLHGEVQRARGQQLPHPSLGALASRGSR